MLNKARLKRAGYLGQNNLEPHIRLLNSIDKSVSNCYRTPFILLLE